MEKRYQIFAKVGVRNIKSFNDRPKNKPLPPQEPELPLTVKKEKVEAASDGFDADWVDAGARGFGSALGTAEFGRRDHLLGLGQVVLPGLGVLDEVPAGVVLPSGHFAADQHQIVGHDRCGLFALVPRVVPGQAGRVIAQHFEQLPGDPEPPPPLYISELS